MPITPPSPDRAPAATGAVQADLLNAQADPFWERWLPRAGVSAADPVSAQHLDRDARAAACLGPFAAAGLFGASFALFAASPESPFGLAGARAPSTPLERLFKKEAPAPAFSAGNRRRFLARAIVLWRQGRARGLRLGANEHFELANAIFQEEVWDKPALCGQWASSTDSEPRKRREHGVISWADGPRYACSSFLRLWLEDARDAGGDALLGAIASLYLSRATSRNRWNDRGWALMGPECARALRWDLPVPQLGFPPDSSSSPLSPSKKSLADFSAPAVPREPLFCALISRADRSELWLHAARWRGVELSSFSADEAAAAAQKMLAQRLRTPFLGDSVRHSLSAESGWLWILSRLTQIFPEIASERPEGSLLWRWACRAVDGPVKGPAPRPVPLKPASLGETAADNNDIEWDVDEHSPEARARVGLRSWLDLGEWLRAQGGDPFCPGPDGQTPLQKIRLKTGHGELVAEWESLALRGEVGSAPVRPGGARRPTRV